MSDGIQVHQSEVTFQPITITLDTVESAKAFFDLVNYLDRDDILGNLSTHQRRLIISLSNICNSGSLVF